MKMESTSPVITQCDCCSAGVEPEPGSLAVDPAIRAALHRIVIRMDGNPDTQEDLFQEAWLYFWSSEQHYSEQWVGWHLLGAKFHLQNLRTSGRSLDSSKRRGTQASFPDHSEDCDNWRDSFEFDDGIMSEINAHDIFRLLVDRLEPGEQTILAALFEGALVT